MRKRISILAAAVAAIGMGSIASANVTVSTLRWANPDLVGYDSVGLFALNDGTGVDVGAPGLLLVNCTITDKSSTGIVAGVYAQGSKASNTTYTGDPSGAHIFATGTFFGTNNVPVYGNSHTIGSGFGYPGDNSTTNSAELYSWIGDGGIHSGSSISTSNPAVVTTATTGPISDTGYASTLGSLMAEVYWANPISGIDGGGAATGKGAWVALAVVPTGDVVEFSGTIGAQAQGSELRPYDLTNPSAPVPEPASMGVLALGAMALLARRRK
jgi:hypothetical protein